MTIDSLYPTLCLGSALSQRAASATDGMSRQDWLPGAIAALGVFLITSTLLRRWLKRTRASQTRQTESVQSVRPALADQTSRDSLERLMVEIQEITRVCAAQIENRATKLEYLIELADQRIRQIEEHANRIGEPPVDPPARAITRSAMVSHRSAPSRAVRDWASEGEEADSTDPPTRDQLTRRVHELSEMGLKSVEIAKQLDEQVGKVELILALRNAS